MSDSPKNELHEFLKDFLKDETHAIEVYKWLESEKAGHDLGNDAIVRWIQLYAPRFRKEYISEKLIEQAHKELDAVADDLHPLNDAHRRAVVALCQKKLRAAKKLLE